MCTQFAKNSLASEAQSILLTLSFMNRDSGVACHPALKSCKAAPSGSSLWKQSRFCLCSRTIIHAGVDLEVLFTSHAPFSLSWLNVRFSRETCMSHGFPENPGILRQRSPLDHESFSWFLVHPSIHQVRLSDSIGRNKCNHTWPLFYANQPAKHLNKYCPETLRCWKKTLY